MLKIIAGSARGIRLETPENRAMRPTSGKGREALFSSLGPIAGLTFADVFAGSGAVGLEAASRGAARVIFVEENAAHCRMIGRNAARVRRAGAEFRDDILGRGFSPALLCMLPAADIWFFDPPYAESARFFAMLEAAALDAPCFRPGALLIWELPDTAEAMRGFAGSGLFGGGKIRELGGVGFFSLRLGETAERTP